MDKIQNLYLKLRKIKRKAFIKARETGLYCHKTLWEQQSQLVKSMLIKAKADYENKLLDLIKLIPRNFTIMPGITSDHSVLMVKDDVEKANILNEFFCKMHIEEPETDHTCMPGMPSSTMSQ